MSSPFSRGRPRVWRESDGVAALPQAWGAYRFRGAEGIAYIGITSNLYSRISQHRSVKKFYDHEAHIVEYQLAQHGATWDDLCNWERQKIDSHSPGLLTYAGGNGRRPAVQINGEAVELSPDESVEDVLVEMGFFDRLKNVLRLK